MQVDKNVDIYGGVPQEAVAENHGSKISSSSGKLYNNRRFGLESNYEARDGVHKMGEMLWGLDQCPKSLCQILEQVAYQVHKLRK